MIKVNGKRTNYKQNQTLLSFLEEKDLELKKIVIEYNGEILQKENLDKVILKDLDELEIISFVGGG